MRPFYHTNAKTLEEASALLSKGKAALIAGGTDLLGTLKDNILSDDYPETVVNIKTIPGLDYIKEEDGVLHIGALTRLADIAACGTVQEKYTALAQAAKAVASPHLRDMGTIGGNIAQLPRCWYFRKQENRFPCLRKGGDECFAFQGQNRFHSIFGGAQVHVNTCSQECPAGTDIPGYNNAIRHGDWDRAAEIILKVNPLPMITGRVCAHTCQTKCNRAPEAEPVYINSIERTLGDYILDHADKFYKAPAAESGKSVAVVGGGPAGLSAAYYLRKAGNKVTVYDVMDEVGGMLMHAIPAYRLPKDVVRRVVKALEGMGIEFRTGVRVGVDVKPEELEKQYDSVCYSTGTWKRPVAGISGEELTNFGLDFLVEVEKWMDGKIGSDVIVTGGGNVAMDVAITAKRLGAKNVTMACLESREIMPASPEEIARAEEEGVVIMPSWGLSKVIEENGQVKGMELKRCTAVRDASGRFNPQYDENEKTVVKAEHILMAIGQTVDLSFLDEKYQLQLSPRGLIDIDDNSMTSREGIYAAGDAATGPGTVIRAIANGHKAANGMNRYLGTTEPVVKAELHFTRPADDAPQRLTQLKLREVALSERSLTVEDSFTPSLEEATEEARRCFSCACYAVHPSDLAPALIALDATVVTTEREIPIGEFFTVKIPNSTVLKPGEIITEIRVPAPKAGVKTAFIKFAYRKAIDFPIVNVAVAVGGDEPRVCLNAVAPVPIRAKKAEALLKGKAITEELAEAAGEAAVYGAEPYEDNRFKVQIAKVMVKRVLMSTL